jgi:molecular chaperone DnaJ
MKNYYEILEVEKGISDEDLKKAYRKKAMEWHPDKHHGKPTEDEANEKFKDVVEAYENLQKGIGSSEEVGSRQFSDDHINNMMRDFMRRAGGFGFGNQQQDFYEQINTQVTIENLYNEEEIPVTFQAFEKDEVEKCSDCDGQGQKTVVNQHGNMQTMRTSPCHKCQGQGFSSNGSGTKKEFKIVANVQNLVHSLPLGKVGSYNPLSGDMNSVMVKLDLIKSANYHLVENGMGLMMTLPVSYEHLRDGKKLRISIFNNKVTINIPPKPSMQKMLVVPEKGMPLGNNHRGNLYIKLDLKY